MYDLKHRPYLAGLVRRTLKVAAVIVIFWCVASVYLSVFLGTSDFNTTVLTYAIALGGCVIVVRRGGKRTSNLALSVLSVLCVLFMGELMLRFVLRKHLTYSELHNGRYGSPYYSFAVDNLLLDLFPGRKSLHTLEFNPFEIRGNASQDKYYPDFASNALGLRGELTPDNRKVILILGDSFAEGAGAPSDSTFPALLQHLIEQHDTTYAVMNAGVSGNDPFFDWMMLQKLRDQFDIRHVVFLINTTDLNDIQMRGGFERFLPNGGLRYRRGPWWEPIYAVSHVSRLFVHGPMGMGMNLMTTEEDLRTRKEAIVYLIGLLNEVVLPYAQQQNIVMHVVLHPLQVELTGNEGPFPQLAAALVSLDDSIHFSNICSSITHSPNPEDLYWPTDGHFKPAGYAMLASKIHNAHFTSLTPSMNVQ